jgi:phosphoglycerol transferase MdoB-like AlkP superfamily enzyme
MARSGPAKLARYAAGRLHLLALPLLLFGYLEYLCRGKLYNAPAWLAYYPSSFLLNVLIALALLLFVSAFSGRSVTAYAIVAIAFSCIGLVSGTKLRVMGIPLMPWDVVLSKEASNMAVYVSGMWNWKILFSILAFSMASIALFRWMPGFDVRYHWGERAAFLAFAAFMGFGMLTGQPVDLKEKFRISDINWNQAENYKVNGFLATSFINFKLSFVPVPDGYAKKNMQALVRRIMRRSNVDSGTAPNIIFILSESLWDPTQLPKVTFDRDPLPNLHALMKTYTSGKMLSPQFGGGTANVEFEILTGNSMRFMPPGSVPFIQYIQRGVDSMASILARQGYAATAISAYHNWFFNRNNTYRNLGFAQYISGEFFEQNIRGRYVADSEVFKQITAQTEQTAAPEFIFATTMENHYPFDPEKFDERSFKVTGNVSEATRRMLETYATGIADSDALLKMLVDYYSRSTEPTILVFFGDHKPILGDNFGAYVETGYFKGGGAAQLRRMYDVPLLIWNNYLPQGRVDLDMSPAFLGPYVLNLAKKKGTPYMDYLYTLGKEVPVIPPVPNYSDFKVHADQLEDYELMEYDMIFGRQDLMHNLPAPVVNPGFKLGFGKMVIDRVFPKSVKAGVAFYSEQNKSRLVVNGKNFVPNTVAYVNGRPVETVVLAGDKLKVSIPEWAYKTMGSMTIEAKVLDSQNIPLADSNKVVVDVRR